MHYAKKAVCEQVMKTPMRVHVWLEMRCAVVHACTLYIHVVLVLWQGFLVGGEIYILLLYLGFTC